MRLRVLASPAGTPAPVARHPFDVLENGVRGARWTVADTGDNALDEARVALLRTLQARVGAPARSLRQVLVRLPRRLSGPRLPGGPISMSVWEWIEGSTAEERGSAAGWAEAIRWLRGRPPSNWLDDSDIRLAEMWEYEYRGAGLGHPTPQRYQRRRRARRGRSRRQHEREVELGLRPQHDLQAGPGPVLSGPIVGQRVDLVVHDDIAVQPARALVDGTAHRFTIDPTQHLRPAPLGENPELPARPDLAAQTALREAEQGPRLRIVAKPGREASITLDGQTAPCGLEAEQPNPWQSPGNWDLTVELEGAHPIAQTLTAAAAHREGQMTCEFRDAGRPHVGVAVVRRVSVTNLPAGRRAFAHISLSSVAALADYPAERRQPGTRLRIVARHAGADPAATVELDGVLAPCSLDLQRMEEPYQIIEIAPEADQAVKELTGLATVEVDPRHRLVLAFADIARQRMLMPGADNDLPCEIIYAGGRIQGRATIMEASGGRAAFMIHPSPASAPMAQTHELQIFNVVGGPIRELTRIAAVSEERAVSLAARGHRNIVERHDGRVHPLLAEHIGARSYRYPEAGEHIRTVVLDMTGGAPSIEIPEFGLSAIASVEARHEEEIAVVGLRGDDGPARQAPAILDTLRAWEPLRPVLNLRVETERAHRQVPCVSWVVRGDVAVFRLRDP